MMQLIISQASISSSHAALAAIPSLLRSSPRVASVQHRSVHSCIGLKRAIKSTAAADFSDDFQENSELEKLKLAKASKRLIETGWYFKRLGFIGFWSQLTCTLVSAGISAFSVVITGKPTSPQTFYLTAAGIVAGFIAAFWSFGYSHLGNQLRSTHPTKAPARSEVMKRIRNGIIINMVGMGSTILGMQATVGVLVAKALTSTAAPNIQNPSALSPVLALDVFLVQASANIILSHFLGLVWSLELLRFVNLSSA